MTTDFPFDEHLRFTPADDELHEPGPQRDWTETTWWSFAVPDRALAGWLYVQVRPNAGSSSGARSCSTRRAGCRGSCRTTGSSPTNRCPSPSTSARSRSPTACRSAWWSRAWSTTSDIASATRTTSSPTSASRGSRRRCRTSRARRRSPARRTTTSTDASPASCSSSVKRVPVDCLSVRDRSWGRRPELLGRRTRFSYCFGAVSPDEAFLAFCRPPNHLDEAEELLSGYLVRDGRLRRLAHARRVNQRDERTDGVAHILLDAVDTDGRELHATADAVSRMALSGGGSGLTVNTMLRWTVAGVGTGWGEDQEVWSLPHGASTARSRGG